MRLVIRDTPNLAAEYVSNYIADRITTFAPSPARPFVLGLPTGNSPLPIYRALINLHKTAGLSFRNVVTFNMDSYCDLPVSHPASYHSFMYVNFFSQVDIQPQNVHLLDGNAADYEAECAAYEAKMQAFGGVEMWLGGVGEDGHVAFNEPGSSLVSRTRMETLAEETRRVNCQDFEGTPESCPERALTIGLGRLLEAREVVIIATGARKAIALRESIEGGVNHMWTQSALQLHPKATIVADEQATLELKVRTVKYFKSTEPATLSQPRGQSLAALASKVIVTPTHKPEQQQQQHDIARKRVDSVEASPILATTTNGDGLAPPVVELTRPVTPDLVPDAMHDRLPGENMDNGVSW